MMRLPENSRVTPDVLIALMILLVGATASCTPWAKYLRRGDFAAACEAAHYIGNDRRSRAAVESVSRERTRVSDAHVTVSSVGPAELGDAVGDMVDQTQFRIVKVTSAAPVRVRAIRSDQSVYLAVEEERLPQGLTKAVGLEVSTRPAPMTQWTAESIDRYFRRITKGGFDPALRNKNFGVVPECAKGEFQCAGRRKAFRSLASTFASSSECEGPTCSTLQLLRRGWETSAPDVVRVEVRWELDGCPAHHYADVPLNTRNDNAALAGEWTPRDDALADCTRRGFHQARCQAELE